MKQGLQRLRWRLFNRFADRLIERSKKTPYWHLEKPEGGIYMGRYWIVPFADPDEGEGCGIVCWWRRPFARVLQFFNIAIRVHHTLRSDLDRHLHDHPGPSVSLLLREGYLEHMPLYEDVEIAFAMALVTDLLPDFDREKTYSVWRGPGSIVFRKATDRHLLELPAGKTSWSLFVMFKKSNEWGFYTPHGKIPRKEYNAYKEARGL